MKKIQFKHLCWVFAFVYMSFMACNSYASICFLPTGECTDGDMDIVTTDNVETWSENADDEVSCGWGYSKSGCTPSDVIKCSSENGKSECVKKECNTAKGWYSDCRASGRQTCETSNGCYKVVNVECPTGTLANCPPGDEVTCTETEEGCFRTFCNLDKGFYLSCPDGEECMQGTYGCYSVIPSQTDCDNGSSSFSDQASCETHLGLTCVQNSDGCWVKNDYECDDVTLFSTEQKCLDAGKSNCFQFGNCWKGLVINDVGGDIVTCETGTYNTKELCEKAKPGFNCIQNSEKCWEPASENKCDEEITFSTITACQQKNPGKTCALNGNGCFRVQVSGTGMACNPNSGMECAGVTETYNCRKANDALRDTSDSTGCNESARHMCTVNAGYDTDAEQRCRSVTCGTVSWNCVNSDGAEQTVTCLYLPWYNNGQGSAVGQREAQGWAGCRSFGFTSK